MLNFIILYHSLSWKFNTCTIIFSKNGQCEISGPTWFSGNLSLSHQRYGLFLLPLKLSRTLWLPGQREYRKRCCVIFESRSKQGNSASADFPSLSLVVRLQSLLLICQKSNYLKPTKFARSHRETRSRDAQRNLQLISVSSLHTFQVRPYTLWSRDKAAHHALKISLTHRVSENNKRCFVLLKF